ncbi:MAG: hypothetical protein RR348_02950, partial [Clostridia bacterium]
SDGVLRGLGKLGKFMITTFSDLLVRVVLAFGLAKVLGYVGVAISWPIGWFFGTVLSVAFAVFDKDLAIFKRKEKLLDSLSEK